MTKLINKKNKKYWMIKIMIITNLMINSMKKQNKKY